VTLLTSLVGIGPERFPRVAGPEIHLVVTPDMSARGIGMTAGTHLPEHKMLPYRQPIS
jgi:hypothetical protein